nr:J490 [uncultured bacterium]
MGRGGGADLHGERMFERRDPVTGEVASISHAMDVRSLERRLAIDRYPHFIGMSFVVAPNTKNPVDRIGLGLPPYGNRGLD